MLCANEEVFAGSRRVVMTLPGLNVEYSWLPPFRGESLTRPNRVEVVFSAHDYVALEQERVVHEVRANPGGCFVVGAEPPTLLCVPEYSDTLEMYPDMGLLRAAATDANIRHFELEPTVRSGRATTHRVDPALLGVAHVLRRASLGTTTISDVGASQAAHLLVARVLENQHGIRPRAARPVRLGSRALATLAEHIEANLEQTITINELARLAGMSPFHFARCFKRSTGLAPHQYVLARRIDRAKRLLLTTGLAVQAIAWKIGFENVNHFRRQFRSQFGVTPGGLRAAIRARRGDGARS